MTPETCQEKSWREGFLTVPNEELRSFLGIIHDSFILCKNQWLRLKPDIRIMDIYGAVTTGFAGDPELERLSIGIESAWHLNMTLGELFALALESKAGHIG